MSATSTSTSTSPFTNCYLTTPVSATRQCHHHHHHYSFNISCLLLLFFFLSFLLISAPSLLPLFSTLPFSNAIKKKKWRKKGWKRRVQVSGGGQPGKSMEPAHAPRGRGSPVRPRTGTRRRSRDWLAGTRPPSPHSAGLRGPCTASCTALPSLYERAPARAPIAQAPLALPALFSKPASGLLSPARGAASLSRDARN